MADIKLNTPTGIAVFPALKNPDTKFDELGQYKADLRLPLEEAKPMMVQLNEIAKRHTGKAVNASENTMWYKETDKETGEETGNVVFKIRVKNRMRRDGQKWDRRPALFDAALKPIDVNPWGGTEMRVSMSVYCWDAGGKKGVSLQPQAIQIVNLVEGSAASGAGFGFEATSGFEMTDAYEAVEEIAPSSDDDFGDF